MNSQSQRLRRHKIHVAKLAFSLLFAVTSTTTPSSLSDKAVPSCAYGTVTSLNLDSRTFVEPRNLVRVRSGNYQHLFGGPTDRASSRWWCSISEFGLHRA